MPQESENKTHICSMNDFIGITDANFTSDNEEIDNISFGYELDEDIGFEFEFSDEKKEQQHVNPPFWFGQEDHDHIFQIFKMYDDALQLGKEREQCIRKPKPFIGSILRKHVKGESFQTFDEISIYQKSILPPGSEIPILRTVNALVTWDYENGLPTSITLLHKKKDKKYWQKQTCIETFSYLYCIPYDYKSEEWNCFSSKYKRDLKYVDDENRFTFAPFILDKIEEIRSCNKPRLGLSMSPEQ